MVVKKPLYKKDLFAQVGFGGGKPLDSRDCGVG